MARYFFDITGTVWHLRRMPYFSGIQRTVVNVIEEIALQIGPDNVYLSYLDKKFGVYRTFPYTKLAPGELTDADRFRQRLGFRTAYRGLHPSLRGYRTRPLKLAFHRLISNLNVIFGRERYFTRRNTTTKAWKDFHRRRRVAANPLNESNFSEIARPGDQLVLLDGNFTVSRASSAFRAAHAGGLDVHTLIHDLIPIVVPSFVPALNRLTFHEWLRESGSYSSQYLVNSQATCIDLQRFLDVYGLSKKVCVVPLAQAQLSERSTSLQGPLLANVDRNAYPDLTNESLDARLQAIASFPFVLCVGTLEIRKNIWRLATVWSRLREVSGIELPKLVFAGRYGWMKDDFDNLLKATGNVFGWVEVIESPSDSELEYLYRRCLFLAMPSLYEGWGLPVGEALSYGKTAVVSNTSSLPEVGGDLVEYCDPNSIDSNR